MLYELLIYNSCSIFWWPRKKNHWLQACLLVKTQQSNVRLKKINMLHCDWKHCLTTSMYTGKSASLSVFFACFNYSLDFDKNLVFSSLHQKLTSKFTSVLNEPNIIHTEIKLYGHFQKYVIIQNNWYMISLSLVILM